MPRGSGKILLLLESEDDTKMLVKDEDACVQESSITVIWQVPESTHKWKPPGLRKYEACAGCAVCVGREAGQRSDRQRAAGFQI